MSVLHYLPVIFPLVFAGAVAWFFLPAILTLPMPDFIRYVFLGFIGLFFIAGPVVSALLNVLRLKNQFERITVTKAFLRVEALKQGKRHDRGDSRRRTGGSRGAHNTRAHGYH